MRSYLLLAAGIVGCFMACQKEPDPNELGPTICRLDQITYYDANVAVDTVGFQYSGDEISKVTYPDFDMRPEFFNGRIVRRHYMPKGSSATTAFDEIIYNPDSTVQRVDLYVAGGNPSQQYLYAQYHFTYNPAKKLAQLRTLVDTAGTVPEPLIEYWFQHNGDNISQVIVKDLVSQLADTVNYSHDANLNYYQKNPTLWLSDNLFADFNGYLLPFALSANNVIALNNNVVSSTVTYEETNQAQIESLRIDGDLLARYRYKCQ